MKQGPLTNITEGGIGPSMTEATKRKISKANQERVSPIKSKNQSQRAKKLISNNNAQYWKNKSLDKNTIKKIKRSKKQKKQDFSYKCAIYKVTDPTGKGYVVTKGLNDFCQLNNLCRSKMISVSTRHRKHHKGWKCTQIKKAYSINDFRYKITDPKGHLFITDNLSKFAKKHKLDTKRLVEVTKGKYSFHKGWKCDYFTP